MKTIKAIFSDRSLRNRIYFVVGILVLTRVLATIPIPGVDTSNLAGFLKGNDILNMLNVFAGGGISSFSIVMLGVGPYITASIIMQLSTVLSPRLKEMYQEEGDAGRRRFVQYGRLLTLPLAIIQGFALITLLERQNVIPQLAESVMITNIIIVTAGTMLMMWLGEQINERGIGNGVSLIIFAGIVAAIPQSMGQYFLTFDVSQIPMLVVLLVLSLIVIAGIVYVTEAERPVPVTYARQTRMGGGSPLGASTYLPLRLNQAGVIPIIFAISILLFPQLIGQLLATSSQVSLQSLARTVNTLLANQWVYGTAYFLLVVLFTYFYTAVMFDPEKTSQNLQKNGAFIPGFRPGVQTAEYIGYVLGRITFFGAVFLGLVAVLPVIVQAVTGLTAIQVGGTSLLIAVAVVLDVIKKVDAQLSMREY
ncbi:preprotein translocase subunit SecY [Candidatus Gracilibacteria bacterium]|nr:preprotein translocase subunit SecY [Candidatus Gracilibacteria bacterium]MCF7898457.1 preprotein translocase subunit SecY [Candidatus Paceibacterota bacterium]